MATPPLLDEQLLNGAMPEAPLEQAPLEQTEPEQNEKVEEIGKAIKTIVDAFDLEDKDVREQYLRMYKKHDFYWENRTDIVWDAVSREWITISGALKVINDPSLLVDDYDKSINIYRAHGESIISAMAAKIPNQVFFPENADSELDIESSKAHTNLAKKIAADNNPERCYTEICQNMYNFGFLAVYNDFVESEEFGIIEKPIIEMQPQENMDIICPECGYYMEPGELNVQEPNICPSCGNLVQPEVIRSMEDIPVLTDILQEPDGREVIRIYSPFEVHVPHYVRYVKDIPYVILEQEVHESKLIAIFGEELRAKIGSGVSSRDNGDYARRTRMDQDAVRSNVRTYRQVWLANWTYNMLSENDPMIDELKNRYKNGVYAIFVDDVFINAHNEDMHEHWTFPEWPTSRRLFTAPLGRAEIPVQDMTTELNDLTMETIEHGITQTFFDPQVFDAKKYKNGRMTPGGMYPVKQAPPGRGLDQAFFQMKTATLSQEVKEFRQYLDYMGQFLIADFPSIFGGNQETGSKTFGEYSASQAQAMQRLSIPARVASKLWSIAIRKAVIDLVKKMKSDQHYVERLGNSFINVWVRKEQLTGKVGKVEPETSDLFPMTEAQRREIFMQMLSQGNQMLLQFFMHPENIGYALRLIGFPDLFVPGDRDRNKQLAEIQELLNSQPLPGPNGQFMPSIPVDQVIDDSVAHIQTIRAWAVSEVGQMTRQTNPAGYENVMAHLMMHMMLAAAQPQGGENGEETTEGGGGDNAPPTSGQQPMGY